MTDKRLSVKAMQSLDPAVMIELFELRFADASILRLTSDATPDGGPIRFAGNSYQPAAIKAEGLVWSAQNAARLPRLKLANTDSRFFAALEADRLTDIMVTRILTLQPELEAPLGQGGGSSFAPEGWRVNRLLRMDKTELELELASGLPLEGLYLPARLVLRDHCQHSYRRWDVAQNAFDYTGATCPYTGTDKFTTAGEQTENARQDQCSRRLTTGCRKRFSGELPFLGFPGVAR